MEKWKKEYQFSGDFDKIIEKYGKEFLKHKGVFVFCSRNCEVETLFIHYK
jgi:hypothetical protein